MVLHLAVYFLQALAPENTPLGLFISAQDGNDHDVDDPQFELLIIIQDRNDNHPRIINFPSEIIIAEVSRSFLLQILMLNFSRGQDTLPNSELLTVEATDEDDGANALVFYYLQTNTVRSEIEG